MTPGAQERAAAAQFVADSKLGHRAHFTRAEAIGLVVQAVQAALEEHNKDHNGPDSLYVPRLSMEAKVMQAVQAERERLGQIEQAAEALLRSNPRLTDSPFQPWLDLIAALRARPTGEALSGATEPTDQTPLLVEIPCKACRKLTARLCGYCSRECERRPAR